MNTSGNLIPLHLNNIKASIYSADTSKLLGTGHSGAMTRKAGAAEPLNITVNWHYSADNDSDTTCMCLGFSFTSSVNFILLTWTIGWVIY